MLRMTNRNPDIGMSKKVSPRPQPPNHQSRFEHIMQEFRKTVVNSTFYDMIDDLQWSEDGRDKCDIRFNVTFDDEPNQSVNFGMYTGMVDDLYDLMGLTPKSDAVCILVEVKAALELECGSEDNRIDGMFIFLYDLNTHEAETDFDYEVRAKLTNKAEVRFVVDACKQLEELMSLLSTACIGIYRQAGPIVNP